MNPFNPIAPAFPSRFLAKVAPLAVLAFALAAPPLARAGWVSGTLTTYEGGAPETDRSLHFQNRATHDIYMAPTARDGSFGVRLPPGVYQLRAERGAILRNDVIVIRRSDIPLGRISDLAPYAFARVFDYQYIAPSLLITAAPSTANINTLDSTPLPNDAVAMPKPHTKLPESPAMARPLMPPSSYNNLPAE